MKRYLLLLINVSLVFVCLSQSNNTSLPVYVRFPDIPAFTIYKAPDSAKFTRENLKKKPAVFIIFDPECDHCQRETDSIISNISKFKKAQIIMVTWLAHRGMVKFYHDYKIAKYPLITMGSDPKMFFPLYFKVGSLPAIFVYDKNGKFKKSFDGTVSIHKIASAF
ncbi:MAG: redoxin domain-containing protein [Ginsengibacter sp.]